MDFLTSLISVPESLHSAYLPIFPTIQEKGILKDLFKFKELDQQLPPYLILLLPIPGRSAGNHHMLCPH